jgi:opacity protein-like surface antigen
MKQLSSLIFVCTLWSLAVQAQETPVTERATPGFSFNGNFQVGIPLDAFRENLDRTGFGGGLTFLINLAQSPIAVGLDLGIMGYDRETAAYRVNVGGFTKDYELTTSNSIFLTHAVLRVQPRQNSLVLPYLDGMVGFKNLFTSTSLTDLDFNETVDSDTDESDWAFSYGVALGVQIHFNRTRKLSLDLRCAYLPGNNASYLVRAPDPLGGTDYDDPIEAFEQKNSPTTLLIPQVGLTYKFWKLRH